jgi:hypothetical protein
MERLVADDVNCLPDTLRRSAVIPSIDLFRINVIPRLTRRAKQEHDIIIAGGPISRILRDLSKAT